MNDPATQAKLHSLQELRDSGVLTEAEYQQKVQAVQASAPVSSPASSGGSGQTWHMRKAEWRTTIGYDAMPQWGIPAYPRQELAAMTILVPVDWKFQAGQVAGKMDCNLTTGQLGVTTLSPDQRSAMLIMPVPGSVWTTDRGVLAGIERDNQQYANAQHCQIAQPQPLGQRIVALAKEMGPDLQLTGSMEPVPGLSDQLATLLQQTNASLAQAAAQQGRPASRLSAEAGRVHFTRSDATGTGEGYVTVLQTVREDPLPGGSTLVTTEVPMRVLTGTPMGKLKESEPMFAAMMGSLWINPEYQAQVMQIAGNIAHIRAVTQQRIAHIHAEMAADNARTAMNIANIQRGVQQYRSQVMSNVAANRSAALEHSSQQFALYMGDQAVYKDSSTGQSVQLPSNYGHVWASTTGNTNEYILTDSASYDPNGKVGSAGWSQMQMQH